jgi:predicted deacylase
MTFLKSIVLLLVFYILVYLWANRIDVVVLDSNQVGPTVLIVGSTHGNEPAGTVSIEHIISNRVFSLQRGQLILIPRPNKLGYLLNMRWLPYRIIHSDLNRNYPRKNNESPKEPISSTICELAKKADFIIDLHEGWGFHRMNPASLGSGIYPGDTRFAVRLAYHAADVLNSSIRDKYKQYVVACNSHPELNSLRSFCNLINKHYILVETSGQNNIQPIHTRRNQMIQIIHIVLLQMQMI